NPATPSATPIVLQDFREGMPHDVFELAVDFGFQPKVALAILYPFKVGHGNAARVRQDVRDSEHPLLGQNVVRLSCRRAVRRLTEDLGFQPVGISAGNLILDRGWNEY